MKKNPPHDRFAARPRKPRSPPRTDPNVGTTPNSPGPEIIPPEWSWHYRTLLHLRHRIMRTPVDHPAPAAHPAEMLGGDVLDNAREALNHDDLWAALAAEEDKLFEVDCALQRIRDGVYGFCEETGKPIPADRLRSMPWTRYCGTVAERDELHEGPDPSNPE